MIGFANPNEPACERCGDICDEEPLYLDESGDLVGLCICCASDVQREIDAERAADFQSLSREWFAMAEHRQSVAYLEWVDIQRAEKAIAERAA